MHLGDLAAAAGLTLPAGAGGIAIGGLSADSRKVAPGYLFAALAGTTPTVRASPAMRSGAARRRSSPAATPNSTCRRASPVLRAADPRRALALDRGAFLSPPAGAPRRRHRHQRQDVGRRFRPPDLRGRRQGGGEHRHHRRRQPRSAREYGNLTTPDPVSLHAELDRLAREGVTHAAIEASSHGLDQRRLDGIRIVAAGFTNLGRDHMDYHPTVEDYLAAKLRLFTDILPKSGTAVIDMDGARSADVAKAAARRAADHDPRRARGRMN